MPGRQRNVSATIAAIKPIVASQLTVPINSSVIGKLPVLLAMAPDTGGGAGRTSVKKEPRRLRAGPEKYRHRER